MSEVEGTKRSRKRSKAYYAYCQSRPAKMRKRAVLSAGMRGVLITSNRPEKPCVAEAYRLFNEYADQLYGPEVVLSICESSKPTNEEKGEKEEEKEGKEEEEATALVSDGSRGEAEEKGGEGEEGETGEVTEEDIEALIARELEELKKGGAKERHRFSSVSSGARNVIFIQCKEPVDPVQLVNSIFTDVMKTKQRKARFCIRLVPVMAVCRASPNDMEKCARSLFAPVFHQDHKGFPQLKFAISCHVRNNSEVKRDDVIKLLASMVTADGDYPHVVNLHEPDLMVVVEIVKSLCCLSVLADFHRFKKYNLQAMMNEVCASGDDPVNNTNDHAKEVDKSEKKQSTGVELGQEGMELGNVKQSKDLEWEQDQESVVEQEEKFAEEKHELMGQK